MNDHSWYVQQLANYTWQKTAFEATEEHIYSALRELIYANSPLYQREIEILSKKQVNLLKAISHPFLNLTTEKINVPDRPFRTLVNYQNLNSVYFR